MRGMNKLKKKLLEPKVALTRVTYYDLKCTLGPLWSPRGPKSKNIQRGVVAKSCINGSFIK